MIAGLLLAVRSSAMLTRRAPRRARQLAAGPMQGISDSFQQLFPISPERDAVAAFLGAANLTAVDRLLDGIRHLSVLTEVADTVTQSLSLDHQLPRLIDLITEALDAERGTLFLHDPDAGELFSRVARGEGVREIRIPEKAGIAGSVFSSGLPEIVDDAYQDARFNRQVDRQTGYRTHNILCVPLRGGAGQVLGVTQVLNNTDLRRFLDTSVGSISGPQ